MCLIDWMRFMSMKRKPELLGRRRARRTVHHAKMCRVECRFCKKTAGEKHRISSHVLLNFLIYNTENSFFSFLLLLCDQNVMIRWTFFLFQSMFFLFVCSDIWRQGKKWKSFNNKKSYNDKIKIKIFESLSSVPLEIVVWRKSKQRLSRIKYNLIV